MLELPYKGGDLSMVVVLPRKPDGLPAVEKQLTAEHAREVAGRAAASRSDFDVYLPRFKIETRFELPRPAARRSA